MSFIFHPGEPARSVEIGGKAAALAAMHDNGYEIPKWFVLKAGAFEAGLSGQARRAIVGGTNSNDDADCREGLQILPAVAGELSAALTALCPDGELVAVRSSAPDEDGTERSFAGQLESFLMVPLEEVFDRIQAVWKSAFSERVRAYRVQHGLDSIPRPPAVMVQRMVRAGSAGVAFAADPITGRLDIAVVSAVAGLGASLVDGSRDADTWHVSAAGKIVEHQPAGRSSGKSHAAANSNMPVPVLDDSQVRAVAALVRKVSEHFGCPQDVEWAFEGGRLYILQSRPITTLPKPGELNIWDNSNIVESYSGVTLPLTFSFARRAYTGVYRQFCQMLAVPKSRIAAHEHTFRNMLGLIRGRVYYNLLNWYRVLALLPGFTLNRRFMEQMMGVKEELPAEVLTELGNAGFSARLKDGFDVTCSLAALAANHFLLPLKIRRFYSRLDKALASPKRPLGSMSSAELIAYFDDLEKKLLTRWDAPLLNDFFAMIFYGVLRQLITKWVNDTDGTLQNDLLCGGGGMISAEPAERIREMAALASVDSSMVQHLRSGPLHTILLAMDAVPKLKDAYLGYLAKFGDRCLGELKLESTPLHDDPMVLLRAVGQLAGRPAAAMAGSPADGCMDVCRKAEARVEKALEGNKWRRMIFNWVLRQTRARVRDRENLRFERTRLFGRVRRIFLELGQRLRGSGKLDEPRDVFLIEIDELRDVVSGYAGAMDLKNLAAMRHHEFSHYRATDPPPNRFTTHGAVHAGSVWEGVPLPSAAGLDPEQRKGTGCCPGLVRGRVRRVIDPRNAVIHQSEILVAERTDPGWIMLFPAAAGLLIERGSLLSHSAIVAREMRIPAIVSIDGLMNWLDDGDEVEFDGSTGVLRRLGRFAAQDSAVPFSPLSTHAMIPTKHTAEADLIPSVS